MSLPHDEEIQSKLLRLLAVAPDGTMGCADVYGVLAQQFPELTRDELTVPYRASVSHWANRVQFARWHLVEKGLLLRYSGEGRGFWTISDSGRKWVCDQQTLADDLLKELMSE